MQVPVFITEFLSSLPPYIADWVWLPFLIIGFSLFFTAFYFRHRARQLSKAIMALYDINDGVKQDALDFFDHSWSILHSVGCVKLHANIDWFGERKNVVRGLKKPIKEAYSKSYAINRDDMRFQMVFELSREAYSRQSVASLVIRTFISILEEDLILKQSEILASQKRLERYQLFVQHEIKNIAQFIQLLAEQVKLVETDQAKVKLVDRISDALPAMSQRARKTIDHLQQPLGEMYEKSVYKLEDLIKDVVQMFALEANVLGEASTNLPRLMLIEVFKNILGNYRDHASSERLNIQIRQDSLSEFMEIRIQSRETSGREFNSERMFEPFWTTSESGMGLGLFLARELLKQFNGEIEFFHHKKDGVFGFHISVVGIQD